LSGFDEVLDIARKQSLAIANDDLLEAIRLLDNRAALLAHALPAGPEDAAAIREVLRRDRDLSSAIRERMIELRTQAVAFQRGRVALAGYQTHNNGTLQLVDARR
jgi:hypothetical protein